MFQEYCLFHFILIYPYYEHFGTIQTMIIAKTNVILIINNITNFGKYYVLCIDSASKGVWESRYRIV